MIKGKRNKGRNDGKGEVNVKDRKKQDRSEEK